MGHVARATRTCGGAVRCATGMRYRALLDAMDQGVLIAEVVVDGDGRPVDLLYLEANAAATLMVNADVLGRRLSDLQPAYDRAWCEAPGRVARTGVSERQELYAPSLEQWFDLFIVKLGDAERQVAIIFADVTAERQAEETLRASERRFRTLVQHSADAIVLVTPEGVVRFASDSTATALGYRAEELVGSHIGPFLHPEDRDGILAWLAEVAATPGGVSARSYRVRHRNRSWVGVETVLANHLDTPYINALVGHLRDIPGQTPDGTEPAWDTPLAVIQWTAQALQRQIRGGRLVHAEECLDRLAAIDTAAQELHRLLQRR
jgi:PAS domain S-box-containing protein